VTRRDHIERRGFVKLCAGTIAAVSARPSLLAAADDATLRSFRRVRLVDGWERPLPSGRLREGETYVFHYPYVTTPCFLIDLGRPARRRSRLQTEAGDVYRWRGGVGPRRSVVAFSAICAHKMTHPSRSVSFINYRHERVSFRDEDEQLTSQSRVIYCCSEKSVYDPSDGARVLGGPAPQPLAAVLLEHVSEEDALYAVGTYGGELFDRYFETFSDRLQLEYLISDVQREVRDTSITVPLETFSRTRVLC